VRTPAGPDPLSDHLVLAPALARAGVGLCMARASGEVEGVNQPWLQLAGLPDADAALGRHLAEPFPGSADALRGALARAERGEVVTLPAQPGAAGGEVWWEATLAPLPGARVVVVARDVSDRFAAQAAADRVTRLQRFTAAVSSAVRMKDVARVLFEQGLEQLGARAVGIMWTTTAGKLELVFGHGVTAPEFRALDAAARAGHRLPVRDALRERRSVWVETPEDVRQHYPLLEPLRALRGETGFAVVPLVVGDRSPGVIGFTFDRPRHFSAAERGFVEALAQLSAQAFERARLFEAEQEARHDAERTRDLQHRLMSIVGHDLRTPLNAVLFSAGVLASRGDLAPDQGRVVDRIASSASRMSAIIQDLLDLGRARQGLGVALHAERLDLGELVHRAVTEFEGSHGGRVALAVHGDSALEGDAGRLAQVVSNLVGNALQHGAGPVQVDVDGRSAEVALAVHNGGRPIPADLLPHVFEPFRRGADAGPAAGGSTGLGLFIVREIVTAHRGTIGVSSDEASGTTFTVRLPRRAGSG
jgi:signal transduction histidine kinase